ncbi:MAG: helix-turn-helix domain containing protein [Candidatus Pacebacteria bacterium]|nr:helix-turn-helix domain containing protein [Candidatus Paceibacterota bacterium]
MKHSKEKREEVIKMRFRGKSYSEIAKEVGVAKSTVSRWCRNLEFPVEIRGLMQERIIKNQKCFESYNENRSGKIKIENQETVDSAKGQIKLLSNRELMLVGSALYWAEGYKIEKQKYPLISFANSDYTMVLMFMRFLREVMGVQDKELNLTIRIYSGMDKEKIIKFWSGIINVPVEKFRVGYQVSRASQRKKPFNALPFGTIRVLVCGRKNAFKIKGWIDGLRG